MRCKTLAKEILGILFNCQCFGKLAQKFFYMGSDYYDIVRRRQLNAIKSQGQRAIENGVRAGFPNCKGTYPDCPEKPTKDNEKCRNCPVLEEILEREANE